MTEYAPHQQRVIDEQAALDIKVNALNSFIDHNEIYLSLPLAEREDLRNQLIKMQEYSSILGSRISRF